MSQRPGRAREPAIRITHVLAPAPFGGLEEVVLGLSVGFLARGHALGVLAVLEPSSTPHPFVERAAALGVPLDVLEVGARSYLREFRELRRRFAADRPDIVHTHGFRPDVIGALAARSVGAATVCTVHGFTGRGRKVRLYEALQTKAFRRMRAVVPVSQPLRERLLRGGVPDALLAVVPNGVTGLLHPRERREARRGLGLDPRSVTVGWIGRVSLEKGPDVFLRALAELEAPVGGCVIGSGPLEGEMRELARELGIEDRVRWAGAVASAGDLLSAFDVFVMSSRTEGTPMVLLEAMQAGVPLVCTAVGGIPDVLQGVEGALVPSERPDLLAAAVGRLLASDGLRSAQVASSSDVIGRRFSTELWIERYEAVYRRALYAPEPRGRA